MSAVALKNRVTTDSNSDAVFASCTMQPVHQTTLNVEEIELAHGEMANTAGGCILPGEDLFEHDPFEPLEDMIEDAVDYIGDTVSEWWASW